MLLVAYRSSRVCRMIRPAGVSVLQSVADLGDLHSFPTRRSSDLSRHLARKLSLRRKRSSPNVFEMAATETITSIILIKLIRVSLGTVRHPRRFKIVVIDIQITLKQMLRDFIGIRVNRAKKS